MISHASLALGDLVQRYRDGMAAYNAGPPINDLDDGFATAQATYGDPLDVLTDNPPPPRSYAEAIAGLEFVLSEISEFDAPPAALAVLNAVLPFLAAHEAKQR